LAQNFEHIFREGGDAIVAVFGPVGLAVAAEVDSDRLPATLGDSGGCPAPRSAGLAAAVQEHHRGRCGVAEAIRCDANVINAVGAERDR